MEIAMILSGEHKTLPPSEVKNLLRAENIKYKVKYLRDKLMTLETRADKIPIFSVCFIHMKYPRSYQKQRPGDLKKQ